MRKQAIPYLLVIAMLLVLIASAAAGEITAKNWTEIPTQFRPLGITAVGDRFWVCGADEMILTSGDKGITWETRHQNRDGEVLTRIAFVDEKVGHAVGTGGLVLGTTDGGLTWKANNVSGAIRDFSFGDAANGIAVMGQSDEVRLTHDGGEHWEEIPALLSGDLRPFTGVLSVAALDKSHFLMIRRHPNVADAFVTTGDGGKSWKLIRMRDDATNRELAEKLQVHGGEYWAFGRELVHRDTGGGYSVPLAMHSKDGETWIHGVRGPNEFESCNPIGCLLWDGAVEVIYGEHEKFWNLPQDGSLSSMWTMAGQIVCTVNDTLKCALAVEAEKPQPRAAPPGGVYVSVIHGPLVDGCLKCGFEPVVPDDPEMMGRAQIQVSFTVRRDGTVAEVKLDRAPSQKLADAITSQLSKWLFEPSSNGKQTVEVKKAVPLWLMCSGFPGKPETNRCRLYSPEAFQR
jgi:photosystem II stability/assembly factor-like uncharacterized protein